MSIAEILRLMASRQPDRVAFTHLRSDSARETLTYGDLDLRARGVAAWLRDRGARGRRVILVHRAGLEFVAAFFGCLYAGAQPVPLMSGLRPRYLEKLSAIAADCQASIALCDRATLAQLRWGAAGPLDLEWMASDEISLGACDEPAMEIDAHGLAYLQYTSGSTSSPRGVRITHLNLMAQLRELELSYRAGGNDVFVSWLPHFHDMGLVGKVLISVRLGAHCIILSPLQFIQRPIRWLQAISDFRGTISAAPNFAYELCLEKIPAEDRQGLDLSSWRIALNGSEPVRAETHRRFLTAFATRGLRPEVLCPCYGLAEATLMVSTCQPWRPAKIAAFDRESLARRRPALAATAGTDTVELVSCGPPTAGLGVEIVDPRTNRIVDEGAIGEIWVEGDSIADGYFNSSEATAESFGARLPDCDGSYLRTGDLGFFHDGELFIAGRLKDMIVIHGRNLYPQDIELVVQSAQPALMAGRGVALGIEIAGQERLVLVQELRREGAEDYTELLSSIRAAIIGAHDVHPTAIFLVPPGAIPVTSSGKLIRHETRDLLLSGRLTTIAHWRASDCPSFATG